MYALRTRRELSGEDRRSFLARAFSLLGLSAAWGTLFSFVAGCESDVLKSSNIAVRLDVSVEPALASVGGAVKKTFGIHNGGQPVLVIRAGEESFLVLSTVCTHLSCEVNLPGFRHSEILCECHGSVFNKSSGAVLEGPATAPLARFESSYHKDSGVLTITF